MVRDRALPRDLLCRRGRSLRPGLTLPDKRVEGDRPDDQALREMAIYLRAWKTHPSVHERIMGEGETGWSTAGRLSRISSRTASHRWLVRAIRSPFGPALPSPTWRPVGSDPSCAGSS
jgi:hypothetical protein